MTTEFLPNTKESVLLKKQDGTTLIISVGDFITYEGQPDGVSVERFIYREGYEGPVAMTYLPWLKKEGRWATVFWDTNTRQILTNPFGTMYKGQRIDWCTVEHLNGGACPHQ